MWNVEDLFRGCDPPLVCQCVTGTALLPSRGHLVPVNDWEGGRGCQYIENHAVSIKVCQMTALVPVDHIPMAFVKLKQHCHVILIHLSNTLWRHTLTVTRTSKGMVQD